MSDRDKPRVAASTLSRQLTESANRLALAGAESEFVPALRRAARSVRSGGPRLLARLAAGDWSAMPSTAPEVRRIIEGLLLGQRVETLIESNAAEAKAASAVFELPRMTAALARALVPWLDGRAVADLEVPAWQPVFANLPGCGEKTRAVVAEYLAAQRRRRGVWLFAEAQGHARAAIDRLRAADGIDRVALSGALRRAAASTASVELVVVGRESAVIDALAAGARLERRGHRLLISRDGAPDLVVHLVTERSFASAIVATSSGSRQYAWLRERAAAVGLRLERDGFRFSGRRGGTTPPAAGQLALPFGEPERPTPADGAPTHALGSPPRPEETDSVEDDAAAPAPPWPVASDAIGHDAADSASRPQSSDSLTDDAAVQRQGEAAVYESLGVAYIPPALRDGLPTRAASGIGPPRMRGAFHLHTRQSIGDDGLEALALAALGRGFGWIAIAQHVAGLGLLRSPSAEDLVVRRAEADRIADTVGIEILCGIEVPIDAYGVLQAPAELLAEAEFVLGALDPRVADAGAGRALRAALRCDALSVLAHPMGRLLGAWPGFSGATEVLFNTAAERRIALEVNLHPLRRDLPSAQQAAAAAAGCRLVLGHDASSIAELDRDIEAGPWLARSGVAPSVYLNTLGAREIRERDW